MKKIITIHGIRTENSWSSALKRLLKKRTNVEVVNFEYGYFTIFQFLSKKQRSRAIKAFQNFYADNFDEDNIPSIICHSFGTYILFSSIQKYESIKFDK